MRPSAKQLIESIIWSLDNKVAPVVEDKWAASTLRSVHCLLGHLAARVDLEAQVLFDDNADVRGVLRVVSDLLGADPSAVATACSAHIDAVLARPWREVGAYPTVASLGDENEALRGEVDTLLRRIAEESELGDPVREAVRGELDGYVRRRLLRDQPMFMPAFMASNF